MEIEIKNNYGTKVTLTFPDEFESKVIDDSVYVKIDKVKGDITAIINKLTALSGYGILESEFVINHFVINLKEKGYL